MLQFDEVCWLAGFLVDVGVAANAAAQFFLARSSAASSDLFLLLCVGMHTCAAMGSARVSQVAAAALPEGVMVAQSLGLLGECTECGLVRFVFLLLPAGGGAG